MRSENYARQARQHAVAFLALGAVMLALAGDAGAGPPASPSAALDSLSGAIKMLRKNCRYAEAAQVARIALDRIDADPAAGVADRDYASWRLKTLARLAELPDSAQQAFCGMERGGDSATDQGRRGYRSGLEWYERRVRACEEVFGHDHLETSEALLLEDNWCCIWGRYGEAERCAREALAIDRRLFPEDHPLMMDAVSHVAGALLKEGRLDEAEPMFRHTLALTIREGGETAPGAAGAYNSLGVVLFAQGDYAGAEKMLRKAEEVYETAYGLKQEMFLESLAKVLRCEGKLEEAEKIIREVIAIRHHYHTDEEAWIAGLVAGLAEVKQQAGAPREADSLFACAAVLDSAGSGATPTELARIELGRAEARLRLGDPGWVADSLPPLLAKLDPELHAGERSRCLLLVGRALRSMGRAGDAEPLLCESAQLYEREREQAGGGFKRATMRLDSPYPELAACRLDLGRDEDAWVAVESGLGRCLADLVLANHRTSPEETERADSLRVLLTESEEQLAKAPQGAGKSAAVAASLQAEAAWSAFEAEILARHGLSSGERASLLRVQAALDRGTALIGWLDDAGRAGAGGEAWGYVIRDKGPVKWVKLPGRGTEAEYQRRLSLAGSWKIRVPLDDQLEAMAREVAARRIAPLLPLLDGARRLVVIPSGVMTGVPLEALELEDGRWLSDRFEILYAPSGTALAALRAAPRAVVPAQSILLVGDPLVQPVPDPAPAKGVTALAYAGEDPFSSAVLDRALSSGTDDALRGLAALPGSRTEVEAIAAMYPRAQSLLGAEASGERLEAMVQSGEVAGYGILHFATHALVDDRTPERSAIVLSGAGLLSVKEIIRNWRINADLVALSGCQTALGRPAAGEGNLGLAQAFLEAGARSVLVSLWNVDDAATSLFMRRFYADLSGAASGAQPAVPMEKAAALSEARGYLRRYRAADGSQPFAHPAYWAAFVLIGDPN